MDRHTAIDMYQWLREVCSTKLLSSPVILGGPGVVVQIDEFLFRHKPTIANLKILKHCLYHSSIIVADQLLSKFGYLV